MKRFTIICSLIVIFTLVSCEGDKIKTTDSSAEMKEQHGEETEKDLLSPDNILVRLCAEHTIWNV